MRRKFPFPYRGCFRRKCFISVVLMIWCTTGVLVLWSDILLTHLPYPLPPAAERDFDSIRRTRRLSDYILEDTEPLVTPQRHPCQSQQLVVALVASAAADEAGRSAVRATWGAATPTLFFLGRVEKETLHMDEQLAQNYIEAKQFGDMIIDNYIDTYENLTIKTMYMFKWANENCPNVQFFLKTDVDVLVNPWALQNLLRSEPDIDLVGFERDKAYAHRDKENKWFLPYWMYAEDIFPSYLSGTGYVVNHSALQKIYKAAFNVPLIYLEDVYTTGLVANQYLGLHLTHSQYFSEHHPLVPSPCLYWNRVTSHSLTPGQLWSIWPGLGKIADRVKNGESNVCKWVQKVLTWSPLV